MANYREEAPASYKELNSNDIIAYFEDEAATAEEKNWFKTVFTSADYRSETNPVSKYNWRKIKTAFANTFFPEIAPQKKEKEVSVKDRIDALLG